MLNILLPMAGPQSSLFDQKAYPYPTPLLEVLGRPLIDLVIENLRTLGTETRLIFVVRSEECRRFHLDSTLELLAPGCEIVRLEGETRGALCSALMAINFVNNDEPLMIANSDQLFDHDLTDLFGALNDSDADAECLYFDSVHPRWSYVSIVDGEVVEAAERNPISRHAVAGFYYFRTGANFVQDALATILNQRTVDDRYFIAPVFNELIFQGNKVIGSAVPDGVYYSLFTPQRVEEYERSQR